MTGPVFVSTCSECGYTLVSASLPGSETTTEAGHDALSDDHSGSCGSDMAKEIYASLDDYVSGIPRADEVARWVPVVAEVSAE